MTNNQPIDMLAFARAWLVRRRAGLLPAVWIDGEVIRLLDPILHELVHVGKHDALALVSGRLTAEEYFSPARRKSPGYQADWRAGRREYLRRTYASKGAVA